MRNAVVPALMLMMTLGAISNATEADDMLVVENGPYEETLVNKNVDWSRYTKVMIIPAEFDFAEENRQPKTAGYTTRSFNNYWIPGADKQRFVNTVTEAFESEFEARGLELVNEAGPGVLVISGGFYDIVSHVPPARSSARGVHTRFLGAATFEVTGHDADTGELLFQGSERRSAPQHGDKMFFATSVKTTAEVRSWARRFAADLVDNVEFALAGDQA